MNNEQILIRLIKTCPQQQLPGKSPVDSKKVVKKVSTIFCKLHTNMKLFSREIRLCLPYLILFRLNSC